jgi:hypothetical protein
MVDMDGVVTAKDAAAKLAGCAMPRLIADFAKEVEGRRIVGVGYEVDGGEAIPVLVLDNGVCIRAWRDDECNGPGVLRTNSSILCQTTPK